MSAKHGRSYGVERHKIYIRMISGWLKPGAKVLDIGSDWDIDSYMSDDVEYTTLDIESKAIPKDFPAKTINVNHNLNDGKIPLATNTFDIVIAGGVIEHTLDPMFVLRELERIVKKDGVIVFDWTNDYSVGNRLRFIFGKPLSLPYTWFSAYTHLHFPTHKQFKELVAGVFAKHKLSFEYLFAVDKLYFLPHVFRQFLARIRPSVFARVYIVKVKMNG